MRHIGCEVARLLVQWADAEDKHVMVRTKRTASELRKRIHIRRQPVVLVLGAGASRGVSYANLGEIPSPLDYDFFDLLQRLNPRKEDSDAVNFIKTQITTLPHEYRHSMERAFYTLQLRAFIEAKLGGAESEADQKIIGDFACCIQGLLRAAHNQNVCAHHSRIMKPLRDVDTIITFNYDLVAERALRQKAEAVNYGFGPWLYGFGEPEESYVGLPRLLKLHGSSNWRLKNDRFEILTKEWKDFDKFPGYQGHKGTGTKFPIFLPFWEKRVEREPWLSLWRDAYTRLRKVAT
jgi:hypothetical protein